MTGTLELLSAALTGLDERAYREHSFRDERTQAAEPRRAIAPGASAP